MSQQQEDLPLDQMGWVEIGRISGPAVIAGFAALAKSLGAVGRVSVREYILAVFSVHPPDYLLCRPLPIILRREDEMVLESNRFDTRIQPFIEPSVPWLDELEPAKVIVPAHAICEKLFDMRRQGEVFPTSAQCICKTQDLMARGCTCGAMRHEECR